MPGVHAWYEYCSSSVRFKRSSSDCKCVKVKVTDYHTVLKWLCVHFLPDEQPREQPPPCVGSHIYRPRCSQGFRGAHQNRTPVWDPLFWTKWLLSFHYHYDLHYLVICRKQQQHGWNFAHEWKLGQGDRNQRGADSWNRQLWWERRRSQWRLVCCLYQRWWPAVLWPLSQSVPHEMPCTHHKNLTKVSDQ